MPPSTASNLLHWTIQNFKNTTTTKQRSFANFETNLNDFSDNKNHRNIDNNDDDDDIIGELYKKRTSLFKFKTDIKWTNSFFIIMFHLLGVYYLLTFSYLQHWKTFCWSK